MTVNKMVLSPIRKIEESARTIGEGNLDHHINVESNDEIGGLARSLNVMTKSLITSKDEAEAYKKHLEERVEELERFHKLTVDRELKMIDLKKKLAQKGITGNMEENKISKAKKSGDPQCCWDYWKCKNEVRKGCPAYKTDSGKECWLVATDYCPY